MLLTIDISNSYITIGVFSGEKLLFVTELVSDLKLSSDQYAVSIISVLGLNGVTKPEVDGVIISSVVPELVNVIKSAVYKLFSIKSLVVGPGLKTGLHISIENPAQLGADIAACAVGALDTVPLPCVICDFGTATTFSVIDGCGSLQGVVICPGVTTALNSLTENTALLPHISVESPKSVIGKNTIHSMQSGFVFGFASMIDGIIDRIEDEMGESVNIVATGARAGDIIRFCKSEIKNDTHLLLKGLNKIFYKNTNKNKYHCTDTGMKNE